MGAVLGAESTGSTLPVTGSGPFSILLAVIGIVSVAFGGVFRRLARRGPDTTRLESAPTM